MTKIILASCLLWAFPLLSFGQTATLNLLLIDAQTQESIKNVKVHSRFILNKAKKIKTDFLGRATVTPITGDTISFDHPDYYHLHVVLHDHAPHDFVHPLKIYLTELHPTHKKESRSNFEQTTFTTHRFEPQQAHHAPLKIGVIEDLRAVEHRKNWIEQPRGNSRDFNLIDIHLRTKK